MDKYLGKFMVILSKEIIPNEVMQNKKAIECGDIGLLENDTEIIQLELKVEEGRSEEFNKFINENKDNIYVLDENDNNLVRFRKYLCMSSGEVFNNNDYNYNLVLEEVYRIPLDVRDGLLVLPNQFYEICFDYVYVYNCYRLIEGDISEYISE